MTFSANFADSNHTTKNINKSYEIYTKHYFLDKSFSLKDYRHLELARNLFVPVKPIFSLTFL